MTYNIFFYKNLPDQAFISFHIIERYICALEKS